MKVKYYYQYSIDIDIETDKYVEVFIDTFSLSIPKGIRIIIIEEPKRSALFDLIQKHQNCYTYVLTYHEEILNTNPKAILFHCPNTWIKDYLFPKKEFSISTVVGGKSDPTMAGYDLRHELWRNKERIRIPKKFYLSGDSFHSHKFIKWKEADYSNNLTLGSSKEPLFYSMFHICIENTSIKNYFSEKIIDCFQTLTVPIYYGCTNIHEFFNIKGMFLARNIENLIDISNTLTPEIYYSMLPVLKENFERSNEWTNAADKIRSTIIKLI